MKKLIYIAFSAALLLTGCYKGEVDELNREIDSIRNNEIASLSSQLNSMNTSVDKLKGLSSELKTSIAAVEKSCQELQATRDKLDADMDATKASLGTQIGDSQTEVLSYLQTVKTAFEGKIVDMNSVLQVLKEKDAEIDKQIDSLRIYADTTFAAKDWLNATFATIESQNAIISEVETVKAQLTVLAASVETVRSEMKKLVQTKLDAACAELEGNLATMIGNLRTAYMDALDKASLDLNEAFSRQLEASIAECKESVMSWVNEELKDYLTIIEAEKMAEAFTALTGNVPQGSSLQSEIEDAQKSISEAKERIEQAYKDAVAEAIEDSEGKLSDMMIEKITTLRKNVITPIQKTISDLEDEVQKLWAEMDSMDGRIKTVEEQVAAIRASIAVLDSLDVTLKEYVEAVKKELQDADVKNYNEIKAVIDELSGYAWGESDESLVNQLISLTNYIGELPTGQTSIADWVTISKNNIEQSFKLYSTLEYVNGLKNQLETSIGNHTDQLSEISTSLSTIVVDSKNRIDSWISDSLEPYYTASEQQANLNNLEIKLKGLFQQGDEDLQKQIDQLKEDLDDAQEAIIKGCTECVDTSITNMNAVVREDLTAKLNSLAENITSLTAKVDALESTLKTLQDDKEALEKEVKAIAHRADSLVKFVSGTGYDNLKAIVEDLRKQIAAFDDTYGSLAKFKEMYKDVLGEDGKGGEGTIKYEVDKLEQLIKDLEAAEATLATMKDYIDGTAADKNLKQIADDINSRLAAIRTTVVGGTMRQRLDAIIVLMYGEGGTKEKPAEDSLFGKFDILNKAFIDLAGKFRSITYIPEYTDGMASLSYDVNNKVYTTELDFVVKPESLAAIIATSGSMKYISTPDTKSTTFIDFKTPATFTVSDKDKGIVTAKVTVLPAERQAFADGASAALCVNITDYDFVSDFVQFYLDEDEGVYYINPKSAEVNGVGGNVVVEVEPDNVDESWYNYYWEMTPSASWISCGAVSGKKVTLTVAPNTLKEERTGTVTFAYYQKGRISGDKERKCKDIVFTVTQKAREDQTFTKFDPAKLNFSFNGYLIGADGKITDTRVSDVIVTTNDGLDDWKGVSSVPSWLEAARAGNKVTFTHNGDKNTTDSDRTAAIKFTSITDNVAEYTLIQKARGAQTLSFNPASITDVPWDGLALASAKRITVTTSDKENDWSVAVSKTDEGWLKIDDHHSAGYVDVYATGITRDLDKTGRTGSIVFTSGDSKHVKSTYTVKQSGRPTPELTLAPESVTGIPWGGCERADGKKIEVTPSDNINDWTVAAASGSEWIQIDDRNISDGYVKVYAEAIPAELYTVGRKGKVVFSSWDGKYTKECEVSQSAHTAQTIDKFDPESLTFSFNGYILDKNGNYTEDKAADVTVTTNDGGTDWTVSKTVAEWLKEPAKTGNKVTFASSDNCEYKGTSDRTAEVKFTSCTGNEKSFTITQKARGAQTFTSVTPGEVSFSSKGLYLDMGTASSGATVASVAVVTNDKADDWTVKAEYPDWTTVEKDGNTVKISIKQSSEYVADEPRVGYVYIIPYNSTTETAIKVTQKAHAPQTLTVQPANLELGYKSGTYTGTQAFTVGTSDGEGGWSIAYDESNAWMTAQKSADEKYVNVSVTDNRSGAQRSCEITFTSKDGKSIKGKVIQNKPQTFNVSDNLTFDYKAASKDFTVTSDGEWTVNCDASDWMTVTKASNTKATVTVNLNDTGSDRGPVTVTFTTADGQTFTRTVTQTKRALQTISSITPSSITISPDGKKYLNGSGWTALQDATLATVATSDGESDWTIEAKDWLSFVEKSSSDPTKIIAGNNASAITEWIANPRTGTVTVKSYDGGSSKTLSFTQYRPLTVSADLTFGKSETEKSFTVQSDISWTVTDNQDWLTVIKSGNGTATVKVSANNTGARREATVTFTTDDGQTLDRNVAQERGSQTITSVSPNSVIISADATKYSSDGGTNWAALGAGTTLASVATSDNQTDWSVSYDSFWLNFVGKKGANVIASGVPSAITTWGQGQKTGTVTVTSVDNSSSQGISFTQNRPLTVNGVGTSKTSGSISNFGSGSVTIGISIDSDSDWSIVSVSQLGHTATKSGSQLNIKATCAFTLCASGSVQVKNSEGTEKTINYTCSYTKTNRFNGKLTITITSVQ